MFDSDRADQAGGASRSERSTGSGCGVSRGGKAHRVAPGAWALLALCVAAPGAGSAQEAAPEAGPGTSGAAIEAAVHIDRGEGELPILVARDERLEFDVHIDLGILGSPRVGEVTIATRVEPIAASPLLVGAPSPTPASADRSERVVIEAIAEGRYKVYEVRDETSTVILPQEWPSVIHRKVQTGSEHRRRELMLGTRDGEPVAEYRADRHCKGCRSRSHYLKPAWPWQDEKHCEKCKRGEHRIWKDPRTRAVPEGTIDMLSSIQLARTMVAKGEQHLSFTMIDKQELWTVDLERGARARHEVEAGTFDAVEVRLSTRVPPSETDRDPEDFEGLFGIHGTISMWFDERSGRPVLITGRVPAGPFELSARVELARVRRGSP